MDVTYDQQETILSIVIPVLNEEDNIKETIKSIRQVNDLTNRKLEILVADNGSTDQTVAFVEEEIASCDYLRLIKNVSPKGIGVAVWEGMRQAKGRYVTMIPGDGENDAWEIVRYLPLMNEVDIVIPFVYNREIRPMFRRVLSKGFKLLINLSFGMLLNYMNGTVMYRRTILFDVDLRSKGFLFQTELLIKLIRRGYLYAEVPYKLGTRTMGKQKAVGLRSIWILFREYLVLVFAVYQNRNGRKSIRAQTATFMRKHNSG